MKFRKIIYLTIMFAIGFTLTTTAQCHVKQSKINSVQTAQNPESYIYQRTDSSYDAISIHTLYTKQTGLKKHELIVFYTSGTTDTISRLKFKALDSTEVITPLTLLGLKKNDNNKQHTKAYLVKLTSEQITYFTNHPLRAIEITNALSSYVKSLDVAEHSFLADQLMCLLNN